MKKNKDMKKLALMGMAAGMLLSSEQVDASFGSDSNGNLDTSSYLAAKCGSKCGGNVATSCGANSCSNVASRSHPTNYYYQSCNSQPQYYQQSCNSQPQYYQQSCNSQPRGYHNSCGSSTQGYYDPSQWSANQGGQNSCHGKSQNNSGNSSGKSIAGNQGGQNSCHGKSQNNSGNNSGKSIADNSKGNNSGGNNSGNNSGKSIADNSKGNNSGGNNSGKNNNSSGKYQASNGCGGSHGCHGGNTPSSNNNSGGSRYYNPSQVAEANTQASINQMNEGDLMGQLNAQGKAAFNTLSPEGKKLALQLANSECKGKNECKGLNSCKTDKNECAGKGGCKGQSKCSFKDKNLAVKVAAAKMAEKRNGLQNNNLR